MKILLYQEYVSFSGVDGVNDPLVLFRAADQ